jgi:L-asparaginase
MDNPPLPVALIYMGGTFGCIGQPLQPLPANVFLPTLQQLLKDHHPALQHFVASRYIRDSSQLEPADWLDLLQQIQGLVQQGFSKILIVHGTDTLAYTAAFLAEFMPHVVSQPVQLVITGSQFPLLEDNGTAINPHSDALPNLTTAYTQLCSSSAIAQCACWVAFDGQIWPAHTVQKIHTTNIPAFAGICTAQLLSVPVIQALNLQALPDLNIAVYYALPSSPEILAQQFQQILAAQPQAIIILAFGAGNLPQHPALEAVLQQAQQAKVLLVLSTQVTFGGVNFNYAAGQWLTQYGVLSAGSLSLAALYARLALLLCQPLGFEARQQQWTPLSI